MVFYLLFQRNNKIKELRVILFYILYSIINEAYGYYLHKVKDDANSSILFDVYTIVEFCFFAYFFYLITNNKKIRVLILPAAIILTVFAVVDHFFLPNSSATTGLQSILIIAMCIYYFFDQLKQPSLFLTYTINFWVIISFLIYLSGTFFLYIMYDNTTHDKQFARHYAVINSSFNILKNILLSVAMLMKPQTTPQNTFPEDSFTKDWDNFQSLKKQN